MNDETLNLLSEQDWGLLLSKARNLTFKKDDVVLKEGNTDHAIYILRTGNLRIVRSVGGHDIAYARLTSGEIFGEMSFLENRPVSATVIAENDVVVDAIDDTHLKSLLMSEAAFSARFYNSLAITLSYRLRDLSATLTDLNVNEVVAVNRFHHTRLGHITEAQLPENLVDVIDQFQLDMRDLSRSLKTGDVLEADIRKKVYEYCDHITDTLREFTLPESLVAIGYDDLLSFRDNDQLDIGVGAYVFRETFNKFMLSETIAHCYMNPRGFVDDYTTSEFIFNNDPQGDGMLGPYIDHWFLNRPFCLSRRESRQKVASLIVNERPKEEDIFRVTNLACGAARELFEVMASKTDITIKANCIDIDKEALTFASTLAQKAGISNVSFMQENVISMIDSKSKFTISPQDLIYSLDFCDYLSEEEMEQLFIWAHRHLKPEGAFIISNFHPSSPDKYFFDHILEWKINYRDEDDLLKIAEKSPFQEPPEIKSLVSGENLFMICRKRAK